MLVTVPSDHKINSMSLWRWDGKELVPSPLRRGAVTIGNFDAVHRGHQLLAQQTRALAQQIQGPALAITFDPPPHQVLHPGTERPPLTTIPERAFWLAQAGIEHLVVLLTTEELLSWEPEEFFQRILLERLQIRGIVEGTDFRFGHQRRGDVRLLQRLCQQAGCLFAAVPPLTYADLPISSSRVRQALLNGDVSIAHRLLGRPYSVSGRVITGNRRGRTLGFPTANLADIPTLLPADGVYAARVWLLERPPYIDHLRETVPTQATLSTEGCTESESFMMTIEGRTVWAAAAHLGPAPTFNQNQRLLEVHLLDFDGDLYGQWLQVEFLDRIRGTLRFASAEELKRQLQQDTQMVRQLLNDPTVCSYRLGDDHA